MDLEHLPGGDLVAKGLQDLATSTVTVEALLISIAADRVVPHGGRTKTAGAQSV